MAEDLAELDALSPWRRGEVVRHLEQTRHLNYGGQERVRALLFRLPLGSPEMLSTEAPAVFLAGLIDAVRSGSASVPVPRMGKPEQMRVSELLRQCSARAAREDRDHGVKQVFDRLWSAWDAARKLPSDEYDRAELVMFNDPAARKAAERELVRVVGGTAEDRDGFAPVAGVAGAAEFVPPGLKRRAR